MSDEEGCGRIGYTVGWLRCTRMSARGREGRIYTLQCRTQKLGVGVSG